MADRMPHFTCPRCGKVSWHPRDLEEGYCSFCHDWTALPTRSTKDTQYDPKR